MLLSVFSTTLQHYMVYFIYCSGLREYFSQTDKINAPPRMPVMVNLASASVPARKGLKLQKPGVHNRSQSLDQISAFSNKSLMDEYSDDNQEYQMADGEVCIELCNSYFLLASSESPF